MPMSIPPMGDIADRIRRMQQMRSAATQPIGYTPDTPTVDVGELDMSPHEMDMSSQSPMPSQAELDSITRQMQGYSYNPQAPMRDETGALSYFPKYEKIPGATWRR